MENCKLLLQKHEILLCGYQSLTGTDKNLYKQSADL